MDALQIRQVPDLEEREPEEAHRDRMMKAIVEMFRDSAVPKGRDRYSCPVPIWELLWELGRAFGWHPTGTTYVVPAKHIVAAPARRNYQPGGSRDYKKVEEQDAVAWAQALEVAKESPHAAAMIQARSAAHAGETGGELQSGVLDEFIQFAYGGAFEFAICNEEAPDAETDSVQ